MPLSDKAQGVMMGLACGDALGALVEYIPTEFEKHLTAIKTMHSPLPLELLIDTAQDELILNRLQNYIDFMSLPGLYTDDTQQAILLAYSLITNQGIKVDELAKLWVKGARMIGYGDYGIFRHVGPGFIESVNNMMMYKKLDICGAISAGNGAAMRIAPLGLYYHDDINMLLTATIEASLLTHRDIRGIAAAGLIAFTVAYLLPKSTVNFNPQHLLKELEAFIFQMEEVISLDYPTVKYTSLTKHQVSNSLKLLEEIVDGDHHNAIAALDAWAKTTSNNPNCYHNSPFALGSVLYSLYLLLKYGLDIEKAILLAVNGGGDCDTIAAMVGAMGGALHGYNNLPVGWVENLLNKDNLKNCGLALLDATALNFEPFAVEKELGKKELAYRNYYRKMLHNKLGFS